MNAIKSYLEDCVRLWPDRLPIYQFLLKFGRDCPVGPHSFAGRRATPHQCYRNAGLLAYRQPRLTYVEGKVSTYGVPLDHAWCIDPDGVVIDPTLEGGLVREYFGVPFRTDYMWAATTANGYYGLLDGLYAGRTVAKLVELGLEAGQQWLFDQGVSNEVQM